MAKQMEINIKDGEQIALVAKALSHQTRIDIIKLLGKSIFNIKEISEQLNIPASSAAMHIKVLEEAGILNIETLPGSHGLQKVCSRKKDVITMTLIPPNEGVSDYAVRTEMPIGSFTDAEIYSTCGMCSVDKMLACEDKPSEFFCTDRGKAELLWSSGGYVEYRFPIRESFCRKKPKSLIFTFEACSEAPNYAENWLSDITITIAGKECLTWRCPGDFGARRGLLSPQWWSNSQATQYGILNRVEVNNEGTYLNKNMVNPHLKLADLKIDELQNISVRIGNKPDAEYKGGFNLFGKHFGDYPQDLELTLIYTAG